MEQGLAVFHPPDSWVLKDETLALLRELLERARHESGAPGTRRPNAPGRPASPWYTLHRP